MLRFTFVALFIVATALSGPAARAGQPSVDELIQKGLELRREGKPEQALDLFKRAHARAPSPRTFGQMGLVEASLERWVDAETHLSLALANPDDAWVTKNRAFLNGALASSRQHLGDLIVSGPAGTEIAVAGKPVGTLPAVPALRLAEGTVVVTADAPGFKPFEQTVTIQAGARTPLTIALAPLPAAEPTKPVAPTLPSTEREPTKPDPLLSNPQPASAPSHWHTWIGASMGIVGVGLLGWGIVDIALNGRQVCSDCENVYSTKTTGILLAGLGGAAIAAGAAIFFTGPSDDKNTHVALGVAPGSLLLSGRF